MARPSGISKDNGSRHDAFSCAFCFFHFIGIILISSPPDPGWSQQVLQSDGAQLGGPIGAWFADILFFLGLRFGLL